MCDEFDEFDTPAEEIRVVLTAGTPVAFAWTTSTNQVSNQEIV